MFVRQFVHNFHHKNNSPDSDTIYYSNSTQQLSEELHNANETFLTLLISVKVHYENNVAFGNKDSQFPASKSTRSELKKCR